MKNSVLVSILVVIIVIIIGLGCVMFIGTSEKEKIIAKDSISNIIIEENASNSAENEVSNQTNNQSETTNCETEYLNAIKNSKNIISKALIDIDNDDILDLMITMGTNEADTIAQFYTYRNNRLIDLGQLSAGHGTFYETYNDSNIIFYYGHMNNEEIYKVYIDNNQIKRSLISSRTITTTEDYIKPDGCIIIANFDNNSNINALINFNKTYLDFKKQNSTIQEIDIERSIIDIDNDGVFELVIKSGTCEADRLAYFYKYDTNKVIDLGKLSASQGDFYKVANRSYLKFYYGHMGYEQIFKVYIENNAIVSNRISSRQISPDESYSTPEGEILQYTK